MYFSKIAILFLTITVILSCSVSPTGRNQLMIISSQNMAAMGVQSFQDIKSNTRQLQNSEVAAYVNCVANAITRLPEIRKLSQDWEVVVFDDPSVNAFALPGGKIGINIGMLGMATTPGQLAAVIGHEVGHVLAKHGNERVSQQFAVGEALSLLDSWMATKNAENRAATMGLLGAGAQVGVLLPFSRIHETEADNIGQSIMAKAGFDPNDSVRLWVKMTKGNKSQSKASELLSTHPAGAERINALNKGVKKNQVYYQEIKNASKRPVCRIPKKNG